MPITYQETKPIELTEIEYARIIRLLEEQVKKNPEYYKDEKDLAERMRNIKFLFKTT